MVTRKFDNVIGICIPTSVESEIYLCPRILSKAIFQAFFVTQC